MIAFGGGALVSAVALVLVPEGIKELPLPWVLLSFISGGLAFWFLDTQIARSRNSLAQLVAMLADFIPEALALGATFASEGGSGMLLALLIALQNLPEGFNSFRELRSNGKHSPRTILWILILLAPLGPLMGVVGYWWLSPYPQVVPPSGLPNVAIPTAIAFTQVASRQRKPADQ